MKLLIVEDDDKIAGAVGRALAAESFTVERASDGDEGWTMATEGGFDLIVLDILLPGRSGYVLCRDLRAAGNWTPILMLTAKSGELDEADGLDSGADDFLTKPFSMVVLLAHIRALLRRVNGGAPATSLVGSISIDGAARRVWSGAEEVVLTSREFDVLEFLVRREGEVVSKQDILAGVWESDFDGDANIVEVYVGRLRRKLDKPFGTDHISTLRGAGYRIDGAS